MRPLRRGPEVERFVSIDHRGPPVGPVREVTLAIRRGTTEVHPRADGTLVVQVDSFGRKVRRVPSDAYVFGDADVVEQWQLAEREMPEQLRAEIVDYVVPRASRRRHRRM